MPTIPVRICVLCGDRSDRTSAECAMSRDGEGPHRWGPPQSPDAPPVRVESTQEQY